jgi:tripartite-type tricarboxylate transporter receptor subunit TctC
LARLRAEFAKVLADPEVAVLFGKTGGRMLNLSQAETETLIKRDVARWTKLIHEAGVSAGQ